MLTKEIKQCAVAELERVFENISAEQIDELVSRILTAARVFIYGLGRVPLMGRAFAMRLMHLGLDAFMVGDTTTPAIAAKDLLVICSGSGQTDISFLIA